MRCGKGLQCVAVGQYGTAKVNTSLWMHDLHTAWAVLAWHGITTATELFLFFFNSLKLSLSILLGQSLSLSPFLSRILSLSLSERDKYPNNL